MLCGDKKESWRTFGLFRTVDREKIMDQHKKNLTIKVKGIKNHTFKCCLNTFSVKFSSKHKCSFFVLQLDRTHAICAAFGRIFVSSLHAPLISVRNSTGVFSNAGRTPVRIWLITIASTKPEKGVPDVELRRYEEFSEVLTYPIKVIER